MELRQLAAFRAVARGLSFTRAAVALNYVQSSITAQVQALESDLGVQLFDRLGRRIVLTEAGERLLPYAERLLDLAEAAREALDDEACPQGNLALSAPETLCSYRLPPLLQIFHARYPGVQLAFRPLPSSDMRRGVMDGTIDVAIMLDTPFTATGLLVEPLIDEPLCIIAPPDHRLALGGRVGPKDLANESVLLTEGGCSYRDLFLRTLGAAGIRPATVLEFGSVEAIKQCVIAGMGIALLPAVAVAAEVEAGRLTPVRWDGGDLVMASQLVWNSERWQSPALRAFLELAREVFATRPAAAASPVA